MVKFCKVAVVLLAVVATACAGKVSVKSPKTTYAPREYKFPQKYIDINGVKLSYVESGSGSETLLFVHGVGGSLNNWDYNLEYFSARFHVLALDLPGHGNSEKPNLPYSVKLHADFIYQFLKAKNVNKVTLIGHSMGGQAAIILQLKHPEMVKKLVLVAPSGADVYLTSGLNWIGSRSYVRRGVMTGSTISGAPYKGFEKAMWAYLKRDGKSGYPTALVYDAESYPTKEFLQGEIKYYYGLMNSDEFPSFVKAIGKSRISIPVQFVREDLHTVDAPTLIVWGKQDGVVPFENACLFNDLMLVSMMAIFPECGHMPMLEKPDRFNRVVLEFVK